MDKKQQIEEMARVACEHFDFDMLYQTCKKCKTYDKHCYTIHQAEILYNAGYRKIDKNCAVITKAEWNEYQKQAYLQVFETLTNRLEKYYSQYYTSMAVIMQAITDEIKTIVLDKYGEHLNVAQEIKELKQRAVKEFAEKLKEKCSDYLYDTNFDGKNDFDIHIGELSRMIDELLKGYEE